MLHHHHNHNYDSMFIFSEKVHITSIFELTLLLDIDEYSS